MATGVLLLSPQLLTPSFGNVIAVLVGAFPVTPTSLSLLASVLLVGFLPRRFLLAKGSGILAGVGVDILPLELADGGFFHLLLSQLALFSPLQLIAFLLDDNLVRRVWHVVVLKLIHLPGCHGLFMPIAKRREPYATLLLQCRFRLRWVLGWY